MSVEVAIAASFTAEPVREYVEHWLGRLGLAGTVRFAPYGQVLQQLLDPGSLLNANAAGLDVVLVRARDWSASEAEVPSDADARSWAAELASAIVEHREHARVPLLVIGCPEPGDPSSAREFQAELARRLREARGVEARTDADLLEAYPLSADRIHDAGADALGKIPYTSELYAALATTIVRRLYGAVARRPKAIAVDCDNTLWDGVCGERRPAELELPAHCLELQRFLVAQAEAGILVCLCSKNSPDDVQRVFRERRDDMPLAWDHVVAHRINWEPKSSNITELARELDISRDGFVFIDDNPVERAEVEAGCPDVLVIPAPQSEAQRFLRHLWPLDARATTDEDRSRTEFYRSNAQRAELRDRAETFAGFVRALNVEVDVRPVADDDVERIAQLSRRTTQLNTTGAVYDALAIAAHRDHEERLCLAARVTDRFGSYGIVGACFAHVEGDCLYVDALQLSCRALGRGAEHRFAAHIGRLAVDRGLRRVVFRYVETARNAPARAFLAAIGAPDARREGFECEADRLAALEFEPGHAVAEPPSESSVTRSTGWAMSSRVAVEIASTSYCMRTLRSAVRSARTSQTTGRRDPLSPRDEYEAILTELWAAVLETDEVDVAADVFSTYGATSMHAMRVVAALQRRLGLEVAPEEILAVPTVAQQARVVRDGVGHDVLIPLRRSGEGDPLFLVHPAGGTSFAYLALAKLLEGRPIWGIQDPHILRTHGHHASIHQMSRAYLAAIREVKPRGPYLLGGWSLGGTVAFEMAVRLEAEGEDVRLFLFDPFAPGEKIRSIFMSAYWAAQSRLWALASRFPRLGRIMFRRLRQSEDPWERIGMILLSRADRVQGRAIAQLAFPGAIELDPGCSESEVWHKLFEHATRQAPEKVLPGATAENTFHRLRVMAGHARLETHHATRHRFRGMATLYAAKDSPSVRGWSRLLTGSFSHVPVEAQPQGRLRTPHTAFLHERNLPLFIDDLRRRLGDGPTATRGTTA